MARPRMFGRWVRAMQQKTKRRIEETLEQLGAEVGMTLRLEKYAGVYRAMCGVVPHPDVDILQKKHMGVYVEYKGERYEGQGRETEA